MKKTLYMAWRYLVFYKLKTLILILSVTLIVFLPAALNLLVGQSAEALTARAENTPILIGAKGSPLELALNSLYFESGAPAPISYTEAARVASSGLADAIPLYTRFHVQKIPIVGTTLDYFSFRKLRLAQGRMMTVPGECVLGAQAANTLQAGPGDHLVSSPENAFDLAGTYPLKMQVTGVLAPSGSPDDRVVFADIKTSWIIEGLAHGHRDLIRPGAETGVLRREGDVLVANASVRQYNEITVENRTAFHFHGDTADFPLTAVIAVPHDDKSEALLRGRYLSETERVQVLTPKTVIKELLATVFTVRRYVVSALGLAGISTLLTMALVFMLSLRLRKREIETMHKIGGSRKVVFLIMASEMLTVLLIGLLLAGALTVLAEQFGPDLIRRWIGR